MGTCPVGHVTKYITCPAENLHALRGTVVSNQYMQTKITHYPLLMIICSFACMCSCNVLVYVMCISVDFQYVLHRFDSINFAFYDKYIDVVLSF